MLLATFCLLVLSNRAKKMEELHWIAVWVSFPRFRVSAIVFTCNKSRSFRRDHSVRTLHIELVWLTRMSEPSRPVHITSHMTPHVKSSTEKVN